MGRFTGVTARMPTVFEEDGELDLFACARLCDGVVSGGCGVSVCGATGERSALREEEKTALLFECAGVCRGRAPLFVELDAGDGARELSFAAEAAALGADGFFVWYYRRDGVGIYEFTARLATLGLPVCVCRGEGRHSLRQFAELAAIEGVEAVAETGEKPFEALELARAFTERGRATAGMPYLICANEKSAAFCGVTEEVGLLSSAAALFPARMAALWRAAGPARSAECLRLAPLFDLFSLPDGPALLKTALSALNGFCPTVRLPLVPPDPAARDRLARALQQTTSRA